jgi:sugar lactone lactonase YvrE
MIRRKFIKQLSTYSIAGLAINPLADFNRSALKDLIVGHGSHRYKVDLEWGALNDSQYPVNDCHEMVQDSLGRIILLTNHTKNNIIIYNQKGDLEEVWGTEYPGAHGLSLHKEGAEDILYITDTERNEVIKTTVDGRVISKLSYPLQPQLYKEKIQYKPTETAIASNGDIYVADGYGLQYILHYSSEGELLNNFGGQGEEDFQFTNAHGICIDNRGDSESLLITDRMKNQLKRFSMSGELLEVIHLPGAYICRPVIHGDNVYLATIWSGDGGSDTGFISILDKNNQLISAPCGSRPTYDNGVLRKMHQTLKVFQHPHDVCVDQDENLYVAQWNAGRSYPIKLIRV